jgi:hypothetical protein
LHCTKSGDLILSEDDKKKSDPNPEEIPQDGQQDAESADSEDQIWDEMEAEEEGAATAARDGDAEADASGDVNDAFEDEGESEAEGEPDAKAAAEPKAEDKSAKKAADDGDIFAGATPEQRQFLDRQAQRARTAEGHASALQRRLNDLERQFRQTADRDGGGQQQRKPSQGDAAIKEMREKLAGLKEDYPEVAEVTESMSKAIDALAGEVGSLKQAEIGRINSALDRETAKLDELQPDWMQFLGKNWATFEHWRQNDAPARLAKIAEQNMGTIVNAEATNEMIHAFRQHLGIDATTSGQADANRGGGNAGNGAGSGRETETRSNARRQRQLQGSATPRVGGTRRPPSPAGYSDDDSEEAIWDQMEAEEAAEARRSGRREPAY